MSLPDITASAALSAHFIRPVYFVYLDFEGDPVLANTSGADITPAGTGIAKLDGNTFIGIDGHFADLSPVKTADGGSKSITATLSGIPDDAVDGATLALLDDPTKWRSRDADVWQLIRDASNAAQGGYRLWCAGRIVALNHGGDERGLKITCHIEGYLAALSEASNRTYLDQERYDPADLSAAASIAIANGNFKNPVVTTTYNNGYDPYAGFPTGPFF